MYNSLVEKCFKECVESFRRKDLDNAEERVRCLSLCVFGSSG
jgi:import inner membrane translocase subunit TIM9